MPSFLLFLVLAITLLTSALAPIAPRAWIELCDLAAFAWHSPAIHAAWWDRKVASWAGGPTVRYGWALILAQRHMRELAKLVEKDLPDSRPPTLYAPVTVALAAMLSLIAAGASRI